MLRKRVVTAIWGIPLLAVLVWFDKPLPWFTLLVALWGALAILEFYRLVTIYKARSLVSLGLIWTLLFILSRDAALLSFLRVYLDLGLLVPLLLTSLLLLSLISLLRQADKGKAFLGWGWMLTGVLYVGWLLSYLVAIRGLAYGRNWVFFTLFTTFASDTAAFFIGRALGKHHLAPDISPGKTWEGAIGGVFGALILSQLFILPTPFPLPLQWWQALSLGLLVSISGQLGDLVESLLKRNTGVKDSGKLIPGHGGILDRMDSVVFAGVVVYYYVIWVIR